MVSIYQEAINRAATEAAEKAGIEDIDEGVVATLLYEAVTYQKPVMVDYNIIKDTSNYKDSDYQKLAKAFLKKDLQSFYFAMNQGENLAENLLMNVDSDDYPNKKDNDYNYVNRNVYFINAATRLVAEDFPEAVDEDEAKAGFKEVLAAIKAENSTLSEDDEIAEEAGNGEFDAHTKPRQLPNLDCNIICGDSLMTAFKGIELITTSGLLGEEEAIPAGDFVNVKEKQQEKERKENEGMNFQ